MYHYHLNKNNNEYPSTYLAETVETTDADICAVIKELRKHTLEGIPPGGGMESM